MLDKEKHKDDFFKFIIENEKELQKALKKNITFDPDIFDDSTADTVCRIGEYIMQKGIKIDNFKYFFFIAAKRDYIAKQKICKDTYRCQKFLATFVVLTLKGL